MAPRPSYLSTYKGALNALSARTRTPLPSLILSFGVLHELTAIVPLVTVFYGSRTLGIGERMVSAVVNSSDTEDTLRGVRKVVRNWVEEGDAWAARIGRRYGVFGYEKRIPGAPQVPAETSQLTSHLAGDVANAIVAYGVTKARLILILMSTLGPKLTLCQALLPVRIGLSLYLSPAFSRGVIEPVRKSLIQLFRRNP
ncbi:hypothetical protein J132_05910 [Termitomyces sp. J132]|nr:hypothetical protein C0989_012133 [Termitomyces sp. Mn162]KAH0588810.1 hypothetical protein H2248_004610 [Termitomyces sp. 'cryptogamus']KNZ74911.1 hypothetical protein J132_05910 [Termitomyces sp. J132]